MLRGSSWFAPGPVWDPGRTSERCSSPASLSPILQLDIAARLHDQKCRDKPCHSSLRAVTVSICGGFRPFVSQGLH